MAENEFGSDLWFVKMESLLVSRMSVQYDPILADHLSTSDNRFTSANSGQLKSSVVYSSGLHDSCNLVRH